MRTHRLALLAILLLAAAPLAAQRAAIPFARYRSEAAFLPVAENGPPRVGIPRMALGGVLSGAVGLLGGGLIGSALGGGNAICGDDACGLEEAAYGAIIGESVALPLGVHLANGRRGNYGLSLLASAGIGALGVLAVDATNDGLPLIAVPVLQLVASIAIERHTAR